MSSAFVRLIARQQRDEYKKFRDAKSSFTYTTLYEEYCKVFDGTSLRFSVMEQYYLIHNILSTKYGENHVRTYSSDIKPYELFEVFSGKCNDSCEGIYIRKNDASHEYHEYAKGWISIDTNTLLQKNDDWQAFRKSRDRQLYEQLRNDQYEPHGQTCGQLRQAMSDDFENDKFLANEMAFIQDGCTSNDEVFAAPTIMKPDQRIVGHNNVNTCHRR